MFFDQVMFTNTNLISCNELDWSVALSIYGVIDATVKAEFMTWVIKYFAASSLNMRNSNLPVIFLQCLHFHCLLQYLMPFCKIYSEHEHLLHILSRVLQLLGGDVQ